MPTEQPLTVLQRKIVKAAPDTQSVDAKVAVVPQSAQRVTVLPEAQPVQAVATTTKSESRTKTEEKQKRGIGAWIAVVIHTSRKEQDRQYLKIEELVQQKRRREWSIAISRVFTSFDYVSIVPLNTVAQALPKKNKSTESTLITQFKRKKDGSNIDWRQSLLQDETPVNRTQAAQAGDGIIEAMPAVIAKDSNEGPDAQTEHVRRVLSGDNKDDEFATAA